MTRRMFAGVLIAGLLTAAAAACSSSSPPARPLGLSFRLPSATTTTVPASLAQFSVAEARRLPPPTGADAAALTVLARGAAPTLDEILAARHAMDRSAPEGQVSAPAAVQQELAAAASAARRYPTAGAAAKAGYRLASRFIPGIGSHWIKWQLVTAPFDAAQPSMLLFDGDRSTARLAGLSYYTESNGAPTAFTAGEAHWHRHIGLCIVHGVLVGEGIEAPTDCPHGVLLPGRNIWMLHVWVVPGMANRDGVFAPVNPALCSRTAPCSAPLK